MSGIKVGKNYGSISITNRTKGLSEYLRNIADIKQFKTADEEYDCALRALNGDINSRNELINRNLRFVISVAKQYQTPNVLLEDLIDEGNLGLIEAADKFDPTMGFKFISYAVWYIRRSINDYLKGKSKLVRLPVNRYNEINLINKEVNKLEQSLGREIYSTDVDYTKFPKFNSKRAGLLFELQNTSFNSLDAPIDGEDSNTFYDILEDSGNNSTDYIISNDLSKKTMNDLFSVLSEKHLTIIKLLFGLDGDVPKNLLEVSEIVGMSREGVRQIRDKSLKKLKDYADKIGYNVEMFDIK